jgi:hypothetical protein
MIINFDIFHSLMKNRIRREISNTHIVTPYIWQPGLMNPKFTKQDLYPNQLGCGISNLLIFDLST